MQGYGDACSTYAFGVSQATCVAPNMNPTPRVHFKVSACTVEYTHLFSERDAPRPSRRRFQLRTLHTLTSVPVTHRKCSLGPTNASSGRSLLASRPGGQVTGDHFLILLVLPWPAELLR